MLVITFLFFRGFHKKPFLIFTGWIAGKYYTFNILYFSIKSEDLSEREIIALCPLIIAIRTQQISLISEDLQHLQYSANSSVKAVKFFY